jgi:alkylhydroperoxidase family enzyme
MRRGANNGEDSKMALLPYGNDELIRKAPVKLNVARMIANSEAVSRPFGKLATALVTQAKLDPKLREIAILRTAKDTRSVYEWTQHVPMAKHVGVTDAQVAAMDDWQSAQCFNDVERLVLRFTDEVALNVKGSRETLEALKKHLGPTEIVELILSIGFWGMVARLLETTEVDLEEYAGKVNLLAPGESR